MAFSYVGRHLHPPMLQFLAKENWRYPWGESIEYLHDTDTGEDDAKDWGDASADDASPGNEGSDSPTRDHPRDHSNSPAEEQAECFTDASDTEGEKRKAVSQFLL